MKKKNYQSIFDALFLAIGKPPIAFNGQGCTVRRNDKHWQGVQQSRGDRFAFVKIYCKTDVGRAGLR